MNPAEAAISEYINRILRVLNESQDGHVFVPDSDDDEDHVTRILDFGKWEYAYFFPDHAPTKMVVHWTDETISTEHVGDFLLGTGGNYEQFFGEAKSVTDIDRCPICFTDAGKTMFHIPSCKHPLCIFCLYRLIMRGAYKCPSCRRPWRSHSCVH